MQMAGMNVDVDAERETMLEEQKADQRAQQKAQQELEMEQMSRYRRTLGQRTAPTYFRVGIGSGTALPLGRYFGRSPRFWLNVQNE